MENTNKTFNRALHPVPKETGFSAKEDKCIYNKKEIDVQASSKLEARNLAGTHLKVKDKFRYQIAVEILAYPDGAAYYNTAT